MRQVKRTINNCIEIFTQHTEKEARKLFNQGFTISIMTADRDPASSLTTEIDYTKGEELFYNSPDIACNFDQVIEDFAEWQKNDSYGHIPNHEAAEKRNFSYWTCRRER